MSLPSPSDETKLRQLEELIGCQLPLYYREWLLSPDVEVPVPADITVPDRPPWTDEVSALYGVETILELMEREAEFLAAANTRDYPERTLPIGDNGNGDTILLSLRAPDFGAVYYLFHETANPSEDPNAGIFVLAKNFEDWLKTLKEKPTPPPSAQQVARDAEWQRLLQPSPPKPWWRFW